MKYTKTNINLENKFIFFWGHSPSIDGSITKSCFSQWWNSPFSDENFTYKTAEHWMMAKKASLFDDIEIHNKIIDAKTPAEAKKLGRAVRNFDELKWNQHRTEIVIQGNVLKFSQHIELKKFLLQTGERILVEASPVDRIWGIGMKDDHPNVSNPMKWGGLNLLGFSLMEVRDILKMPS